MEQPPDGVKWEYKILVIRDQIDPDVMVKELNLVATGGWEAVSMLPKFGVPSYLVLIKKPLQA